MNHLSKEIADHILPGDNLSLPAASVFALPEKVLQFGTGVLLRGLPDHYIDQANKQGLFNGRIVVVKSTAGQPQKEFLQQDNLYTLCIRGLKDGKKIEEYHLNAAISRVISAQEDWDLVLQCAVDEQIKIVLSNTTEIGISLDEADIVTGASVPRSFPGKLTACLYQRYLAFQGAPEAGMVILPTELVPDNGTQLKAICIRLAELNHLEAAFIQWLGDANDFCNTLVDCIVPGAMQADDIAAVQERLGYKDELMIMSEAYRLWAIETSRPETKQALSFAKADDSIIISENISKFRDLKLRLLNGAHTFSCGLALLSGFDTVKEAMNNPFFEQFIRDLMIDEIAPTLVGPHMQPDESIRFARKVLDRFHNPHIEHRWVSISAQYTAKMQMRNIPTLLRYYELYGKIPPNMALGFAAYLYFMRSGITAAGQYFRECLGKKIPIEDSYADKLHAQWNKNKIPDTIHSILSDTDLWHTDLSRLPGFEEAVLKNIHQLTTQTRLTYNTEEAR